MKKSILIITMFLLALTMSLDLSVTPALAQAPEGEEYTVQARDTLSSIAAAEYGNPQAFPAIVAATNAKAAEDDSFAVIDDPAAIVVGQKLWLPADPDLTEPAAPAPGERVTAAIELTTNPWLWQSFTDPVEQFDLDNPADYTITFNPDGTVNVKADCNNASGTYTAEDSGTLNIELGPMTRAACPPDSRSDEFVENLGFVRTFFFENGFLYLDMMTDGGTFQLASAPEFIPASDPGFGTAWDTVACDTFNVPATVAEYSDCGYVTVPEFHSQPDGPTIQVAVVRARSNGDSPAADPLFMEQGGPGGSSIDLFAIQALPAYPTMQTLLSTRDLVFVEQRGTLYSQPSMLCPEQTAATLATKQGLLEDNDVTFVAECAARLQEEGVNLSAFNSIENAADMYTVAEFLGYDAFNYYGVSYGTLLGQYVIDQADAHEAQLRSVTIDAVVAPDVDFNAISGSTGSYALRNLFAECAQSERCSQQFPDLENVFLSLVDRLNAEPVPLTLTVPEETREVVADAPETIDIMLTGEDLVDVAFGKLYQTPEGQVLPRNIYATAQNNDFDWIEQALSDELSPGKSARAMYFTMLCARQSSFVNAGDFFGQPYAQFEFNNRDESFFRACDLLSVDPEEPFVLDNTDIPTLILNGTHDPITPLPYGEYVGSKLETAYVYTFPGSGHGAIPGLPCATAIMADFLANPAQAPDSSCLSSVQPVFLGFPIPLAELTPEERTLDNGITIALPGQWALNPAQGLYMDPNNPTSISNGAAQVRVLAGQSLAEALTPLMDAGAVELTSDQTFGAYTWTILEQSNPNSTLRYAVADVPEADGTVMILLAATPDTYDAVVAMLWEPMLSSVGFTAPSSL